MVVMANDTNCKSLRKNVPILLKNKGQLKFICNGYNTTDLALKENTVTVRFTRSRVSKE